MAVEAPMGVLIAARQNDEAAKNDVDRLVDLVKEKKLEGVLLFDQAQHLEAARPAGGDLAGRKGMLRGAGIGFLLGLVPLLTSTVIGAMAGSLIARASRVRIEKGTAPRLRFSK